MRLKRALTGQKLPYLTKLELLNLINLLNEKNYLKKKTAPKLLRNCSETALKSQYIGLKKDRRRRPCWMGSITGVRVTWRPFNRYIESANSQCFVQQYTHTHTHITISTNILYYILLNYITISRVTTWLEARVKFISIYLYTDVFFLASFS